MRLLVLGGTRFLGRAIVDEAIRRGHDVTTFSRGLSGEPRPGAEALHGDRTSFEDLLRLAGRDFDAAIDTSVIAPAHVAAAARLLADHVGHYTYTSTISVYRDYPGDPVTENSAVLDCAADATGTVETLGYGELKAGSERAVAAALPGRHLIVRPGLIVGPHENVGRLPWWLTRLARGGTVLAPGEPGRQIRMTDARDLASWLVDNTRRGIPGTVNVPGPDGITFGGLLARCSEITEADRAAPATIQWAPDIPELAAIWQLSGDRAVRTGIRYRPLADTVRDTWLWLRREAVATGRAVTEFERAPGIGLDPAKEQAILS